MNRLRAFLPLLVLVAIGVALLFSGVLERFDPHHIVQEEIDLRAAIAAHPLLAGLVQIGLMALAMATGLPGAIVIVLAGGMLFGTVGGTLLSTIGTVTGALILFLASRSAFAEGGTAPALVDRLRAGYHAYPFSFAMFLRLVPLFPFGAVTVALAWLRCPLWLFLITTTIGGTVMIAFESALGAGLTETIAREGTVSLSLFTHRSVLLPLLGMAVLALAPIVLAQLRRRARPDETQNP